MSTPPPTIPNLPHHFDRGVLLDDSVRLSSFLQAVESTRERERDNGNGGFFHIVATQWMELASLQYVFQREPAEVIESAARGIRDFLLGLEMGHAVEPLTVWQFFSAALALNDRPSAQFIITVPDEVLGFLDDPESPLPLLVTAAFVLATDQDSEVQLNLEMVHRILFEEPLDKAYYPMKAELANLYQLIAAILSRSATEFNERLLERCQIRVDRLNEDFDDDKPSVIDWTALGLVCLARARGLTTTVQHVYLPLQILEAAAKLRQ